MHRLSCFLIAAMIVGFTADLAPAQIGRGRLLKKMRDDLFGTPEERAREEAARRTAEQKRKVEVQQKAKLEAQRRAQAGRQPTPVTQAQQQQRLLQQQQRALQQKGRSSQSRLAAPDAPVRTEPARNKTERNTAKRESPEKKGFGFTAVEKGGKLIVIKLDRGGNADEAGIKRGDQIVGIGGVEVDSEEAFEEIADILNAGDNIEIAYKRGKQTDDVQIGFGSVPETDREELEIASALELEPETNGRNDFVPPQRDRGTRGSSVVNQNDMSRQVDRLSDTVEQQRIVIEQLQNQIRALQNTSAPGPNTQVPPIRSSNSILQTGPSSTRSKR